MIDDIEKEVKWYTLELSKVEKSKNIEEINWNKEFPELCNRFESLALKDMRRCRRVVVLLFMSKNYNIILGTLKLIESLPVDATQPLKMRDTMLSLLVIHIALNEADLRSQALGALWRVSTYAVLPQIMQFAEKGHYEALYMARHFLRSPEEIQQGIAIARKYLLAEEYVLREASLFILQKYSSMDIEAQQILVGVQKYLDELFIDALKNAPPELVLKPLKTIRATIGEEYAEYKDLSATIDVLEKRIKSNT